MEQEYGKITSIRYKELIAKEEELRLLKKALSAIDYSSDLLTIKKIFNIKDESEDTTNA